MGDGHDQHSVRSRPPLACLATKGKSWTACPGGLVHATASTIPPVPGDGSTRLGSLKEAAAWPRPDEADQ